MESPDPHEMYERRTRLWSGGDIQAGITAGLAGGLAMGLVALFVAAFIETEIDIWDPVKAIAGVFFPRPLANPGFDLVPVITGITIQFLFSGLLGALFAFLYRRVLQLPLNLGLPFLMGGVYGLALWGGSMIFLPWLNPVMADADKPAFLLAHVVYGVVLGLAYAQLHPKLPRRNAAAAAGVEGGATG